MLLAGDKTDEWKCWCKKNIPLAATCSMTI